MHYTHFENLVNLNLLLDKGRFCFIGLRRSRSGDDTGSSVRAVAILE
jgi:kynurenine formamidase